MPVAARDGRYNLKMLRKLELRPDWQIAMVVTAALRVFYTAMAAAFMPFLHPDPALIHSNALTENLPPPHGLHYALLGIWERFDMLWFLHIAEHGYDRPMAVIFYPLYPAAIRLVSGLMPAIAAALLVSTVAAFFFFWGLLRLAGGELSEVGRLRTLLLVSVWPTSFVLFAGYAESLTVALVVWAIVFARESARGSGHEARWEAATACGLLAGSARPSGVLVFIPLAAMALRSRQARSLVVALKLGLVIVVAAISLRRQVQTNLRIEDRAFALAVILQMLMYTGRPLLGAVRYVLMVYPVFLVWGAYAERWNGKRLGFYVAALGILNLAWMWAFLSWSLVL